MSESQLQYYVAIDGSQQLVTPTGSGGGATPAPVAGVDDGAVALAGTGGSAGLLVYLKGVAGSVLSWSVAASKWVAAAVAPFRGTFYVDPNFTGLQAGSASNPFTTVAAAFAAAAALSLTAGIIRIAPGVNLTENIVFPSTGGSWGLISDDPTGTWQTLITGTVTMNTAAASQFAIQNIDVEGNVSGNISAGGAGQFNYVRFVDTFVDGTVTLTSSAAASWTCEPIGRGRRGFGSEDGFEGACAVTGRIYASGWTFIGATTWSALAQFDYCVMPATLTSSAASSVQLTSCTFPVAVSFVSSAGLCTVTSDSYSTQQLMGAGVTTSGAGTFAFFSSGGSSGTRQQLTGNAGTFTLSNRYPRCQMVVDVALTLLTPGTLGAIQAVVTYTDLTGTSRSRLVVTIQFQVKT